MSSKPWFPWYPADYKSKTQGLSDMADLAYRRMLEAYYELGGKLPKCDKKVAKLLHFGNRKWTKVKHEVLPFFTEDGDYLKNARADHEISRQASVFEANKRRATAGANARWHPDINDALSNASSNSDDMLQAMLPDAQSHLHLQQHRSQASSINKKSSDIKGGWWLSLEGTNAKGQAMQMPAHVGETWPSYKERLFTAIREQERSRKERGGGA